MLFLVTIFLQFYLLRWLVRITLSELNSLPLCNPVDVAQQMRELRHFLIGESTKLPDIDPWPRSNIRNAVLTLPITGEIFALHASVPARQSNLKHVKDAQGLVMKALNGITSRCQRDSDRGMTGRRATYGIFSFANLAKWLVLPWYGAPLPCQKKSHWLASLI